MTQFAFDAQIKSQPQAVRDVLQRTIVPVLDAGRPIVFTGIGTSLHACRVAAAWCAELSKGRIRATAIEAHEFAIAGHIDPEDQVVVVSHRGNKRFPQAILKRALSFGATAIAVTGDGVPDMAADAVLRTCQDETASTHSVSYVSALAVLGLLVSKMIGDSASAFRQSLNAVPDAIAATLEKPFPVDVISRLTSREPIFLTAYGLDELTAEEAALKIKEGAYLWAESMSVELALHGTPAVFEPRMASISFTPALDDGGRTIALRKMLRTLGVEVITIGSDGEDLPFAEVRPLLRPLVSIVPLQRLVAELARRRGSNPDTTRSDIEPWKSAIAEVAL